LYGSWSNLSVACIFVRLIDLGLINSIWVSIFIIVVTTVDHLSILLVWFGESTLNSCIKKVTWIPFWSNFFLISDRITLLRWRNKMSRCISTGWIKPIVYNIIASPRIFTFSVSFVSKSHSWWSWVFQSCIRNRPFYKWWLSRLLIITVKRITSWASILIRHFLSFSFIFNYKK